jgi:alcohol dehydrogenase class IV
MTIPIEGMFKVPHGVAIGIVLPHVMEFNLPAGLQRFASLARAIGEPDGDMSLRDLAASAISAIKSLFADLSFPRKFLDSQVDRKAIPQMAKMIMGGLYGVYDPSKEYPLNAILPSVNIRKATMKNVIELYEKSFEGWKL